MQSPKRTTELAGSILADVERIFKIAGIIIAGCWAYFNFFKGRTYRPRLEPKFSGIVTSNNQSICLSSTISLKNVGLSKVGIQQKGSALLVHTSELANPAKVQEIDWKRIAAFDVFASHKWIEPGETVDEQRLIVVPNGAYLAFRLDVRVVSTSGIEWNATTILSIPKSRREIILIPKEETSHNG